jgi:hypothetical protein
LEKIDGETSPPGSPDRTGKPPALKALEKIDESTSASNDTGCSSDPYMVPAAEPVHAEVKKKRLIALAVEGQAKATPSKRKRLA